MTLAMTLQIRDGSDCRMAQAAARSLAERIGFQPICTEEIALVAAELACNLVRHAGGGKLLLRPLKSSDDQGVEMESLDDGPGIVEADLAFADGYSTIGSLGYGLGTIHRLMDNVDVASTPGHGTRLVCRRWLRHSQDRSLAEDWDVGAATRARGHTPSNGDAFVFCKSQGRLLAGLIDGLGHGEPARQAAVTARLYVRSHWEQPLPSLFSGASRACAATRGVVMAIARFESPLKLTFATLGNIECRAWSPGEKVHFLAQRGILGGSEPNVVVREIDWKPEWLLVMFSDGVRSRWQWPDFPGIEHAPTQEVARRLLGALASDEDDASVIAVRHKQ